MDFATIRERMADYLQGQGIDAQCAYPETGRVRRGGAVAAVSLRACQGGPEGFRDYLGEPLSERRGLREPLFVQRRVLLPLKASLDVPRRLAVAYYEKSHAFIPPL